MWFQIALIGYLFSFIFFICHSMFFPKRSLMAGKIILLAAVLLHLSAMILRGVAASHTPVANFFESMNQFIFFIALASLIHIWRRHNGLAVIFPLLVVVVSAVFTLRISSRITEMYPALQSIWFEIHVLSAFASYGLFTMGASLSILYFLRRNNKLKYFNENLPACAALDKNASSLNAWGFFWFSFSMLTGGIWAYYAWGNYWIWTAKEIWSALLWVYYAVYIHTRFTPRWAGKRANALSVIGFWVMIFTFLGVNLMLRSSHSF